MGGVEGNAVGMMVSNAVPATSIAGGQQPESSPAPSTKRSDGKSGVFSHQVNPIQRREAKREQGNQRARKRNHHRLQGL
jgi:hypothetical protein